MYCGEVVRTRKKISEHFKTCAVCQQARRDIRVETCKNLEHTPKMRAKYSETAQKTAIRPEIQQQRAKCLKRWRDAHPDEFQAIRDKAHASPKLSKMEMWLEPHLTPLGFVRNIRLRCQQERKQVDFVNRQQKIAIEVDGPWHFLPINSEERLQQVQMRDRMLDREILHRSWRLIRLSMQCFKGNSGELIYPEPNQLIHVINDTCWEGIRCYGDLYAPLSWDGIKVMILK
jgi:very-short-patch-repair endonuclease